MRLALIVAAAFAATPALAQDPRPPAYTNAEACLRDNAAAAVRASNGAADAAEFLLEYVCAASVSAASAYERNSAALAGFQNLMTGYGMSGDEVDDDAVDVPVSVELVEPTAGIAAAAETTDLYTADEAGATGMEDMEDMLDGLAVDPTTGEFVAAPGSTGGAMIGVLSLQGGALTGQPTVATPPVFLRELAGRLVIDLRR